MARDKAALAKRDSDDSEDEGSTKVGIFHHKIKPFKRRNASSSLQQDKDDTEDDDESDDDEDYKMPVKRKKGRKAAKGPEKRSRALPEEDSEDEGCVMVTDHPESVCTPKAKKRAGTAHRTEAASLPSVSRPVMVKGLPLRLDDDDDLAPYLAQVKPTSSTPDHNLERLAQLKQQAASTRQELLKTNVINDMCLDGPETASATALAGLPEREKIVMLVKKADAPDSEAKKFRLYKSDPLHYKLFEKYAQLLKLDIEDMQFRYKEALVLRTDTPSTLGMGDMDALVWESKKELADAAARAAAAQRANAEEKTVTLKLRCGGETAGAKMKITDCFEKLVKQMADLYEVDPSQVRLVFDGETLGPKVTPKELDMEDDDIVDVNISG